MSLTPTCNIMSSLSMASCFRSSQPDMGTSAEREDERAAGSEERIGILSAIHGAVLLGMVGGLIGFIFGNGAAILTWGGFIVGAVIGVPTAVVIKRNPPELKPLCAFNSHLGTWVYDSVEECSQTHNCPRCGLHRHRLEHIVPDWGPEPWRPWGREEFGVCYFCHEMQRRKIVSEPPWS